jgi:hypothetical protein
MATIYRWMNALDPRRVLLLLVLEDRAISVVDID